MSELLCPRCGNKAIELQSVDPGLAEKIRQSGNTEVLPEQVCLNCFSQIAGGVSRGSVLHAREKAKEQRKLALWKSRVNLIKKARQQMSDKAFSDAAVQYEKYLKVLEVIFEVPPGGLTPAQFKESARTQELTVVAGVYWDLLRIYDTSPKYGDRMQAAAVKLSLFLRYTPVFPDIIRKAESFAKTAKNPNVVKAFLKGAADSKDGCFIASAAFSSGFAPEVVTLRIWRDSVLLETSYGRAFVRLYYRLSPPIAYLLNRWTFLKAPVRAVLRLWIDRAVRH
jgi:hypothetical protein